jgi:hypothetical protein
MYGGVVGFAKAGERKEARRYKKEAHKGAGGIEGD